MRYTGREKRRSRALARIAKPFKFYRAKPFRRARLPGTTVLRQPGGRIA